jgi:Tfp pilus assembly protein PilZ
MKIFKEDQPAVADCKTMDSEFKASVQNTSQTAVFVKTDKPLSIGQEIAMTIRFPESEDTVKATGKIVNTSETGANVEFKIFFTV